MDYFIKKRTHVIIIFLIILFSIIFVLYWRKKCSHELFTNPYIFYYLDGSTESNDSNRLTLKKTPLKKNVNHDNGCKSLCLAQSECLESNVDCKSTYEANNNCYCQFKRVKEEGFNNLIEFNDILIEEGKTKNKEENKLPIWSYAVSDTEKTLINNTIIPLNDIYSKNQNHSDINLNDNISVSFWLHLENYPNSNIDWTTPLVPILEIVDEDKNNILSVYLWTYSSKETTLDNKDQTIVIRHKTNRVFDAYDDTQRTLGEPFHLVITFDSSTINNTESNKLSGYRVYKNGEPLRIVQQGPYFNPDESTLKPNNLVLNRRGDRINVNKIYIQNLLLYNSTLSQIEISTLYDNSKGQQCTFNPIEYADYYPDLKAAFGYDKDKLKQHFHLQGFQENRTPCANKHKLY